MAVSYMYGGCPHCGSQPVLLTKDVAERVLKKKILYDHILLCEKGCRFTKVNMWNNTAVDAV